ncbi:ATP-binding protein [Caldisalinibacter kiritimatiensis]|uniref:Alkaline shock protein n=1 Tax=Caldisalinibacter kiritimatiensis TaxID=1304284 RepID=R1CU09_9FIRM|nr:ATP-binding protein [Caldisalinibacter kiritimatiensis]EOD00174.1 hypothetical protein L21TH_1825 [Caldisalinibacter kiritimatiensis]
MKIIALIGPSGTGKSYRAIMIAKDMGLEYIIDDGLLIKGTNVIAGKSAKREDSTISAVKRALFTDKIHRQEVKQAIEKVKPDGILILGTSEKMVDRIVEALSLPKVSHKVFIEDISSPDEMEIARQQRTKEGKHVIPVPTFEIKKDFSGYFIDTLRIFKRKKDNKEPVQVYEKTVVRPTFSYLGKYTIADGVIKSITKHAALQIEGISKVYNVYIRTLENGIIININVGVIFGHPIIEIIKKMQKKIISEVEKMTALNIISVDVNIRKMTKI